MSKTLSQPYTYYEFFSGGGMVRAALSPEWKCLFANDNDPKKAKSYINNWGSSELVVKNIQELHVSELPGKVDLAWASFPCQDLSLAGYGAGLSGNRSGTYWYFYDLMKSLKGENRNPKIIVLENVLGAITSHSGKDFTSILKSLVELGYYIGPVVIDAKLFVPQSRKRLFVVAIQDFLVESGRILSRLPLERWHPKSLQEVYKVQDSEVMSRWLWLDLPVPPKRDKDLKDIISINFSGNDWDNEEKTKHYLDLMTDINLKKVKIMKNLGKTIVGGLYRRTRNGLQRAEVRFDGVAGCLRTPAGGSSRQTIIAVYDNQVMTRLLTAREAARLMGLPEDYQLPDNYNDAYYLIGDGVVVPVVRFLEEQIFELILLDEKSHAKIA
ncbi:MAG: DNA cytosine methyltransferase [bacterium]